MRCDECQEDVDVVYPVFTRGVLCRACVEADGEHVVAHVDAAPVFEGKIDLEALLEAIRLDELEAAGKLGSA